MHTPKDCGTLKSVAVSLRV